MPSFYSSDLTEFTRQIILTGDEFHHLTHVMRCKTGDIIKLNNGAGIIARGEISKVEKKQVIIQVTDAIPHTPPKPAFAIAFSLLRNKNDQWLVEKVTELGVRDIYPITTRYSVRNPSDNTLNKFQQSALSAIKQCDNPFLPVIHPILDIGKALRAIREQGYQIAVASESRPDSSITDLPQDVSYCLFIGPEGGFSAEEFQLFRESNVPEISLSPLILRAETAAITAAAQLNLKYLKQLIS